MATVTWYEAGKPDPDKRAPAWARTFGIASDGTVYAPAALSGDEGATLKQAAVGGVSAAMNNDHAFLPVPWMVRNHPHDPEVIRVCRLIDGFAQQVKKRR